MQRQFIKLFRLLFIILTPFVLFNFIKKRKVNHLVVFYAIVFAAAILQALVTYGNNARFSFPFEFLMLISVLYFFKENNGILYFKSMLNKLRLK